MVYGAVGLYGSILSTPRRAEPESTNTVTVPNPKTKSSGVNQLMTFLFSIRSMKADVVTAVVRTRRLRRAIMRERKQFWQPQQQKKKQVTMLRSIAKPK
eukprot:6829858-Prymnesium_polylepis.1